MPHFTAIKTHCCSPMVFPFQYTYLNHILLLFQNLTEDREVYRVKYCMSACMLVDFDEPWTLSLLQLHTQYSFLINTFFFMLFQRLHRAHGCIAVSMLMVQMCCHPNVSHRSINSIICNLISWRRRRRRREQRQTKLCYETLLNSKHSSP